MKMKLIAILAIVGVFVGVSCEDIKKDKMEEKTVKGKWHILARAARRMKDFRGEPTPGWNNWSPTPPELCGSHNESCHPVEGCCRGYNCIDGVCTCKDIGSLCMTTSDCCWDTMCDDGVCSHFHSPCGETGEHCSISEDCCGKCEEGRCVPLKYHRHTTTGRIRGQ